MNWWCSVNVWQIYKLFKPSMNKQIEHSPTSPSSVNMSWRLVVAIRSRPESTCIGRLMVWFTRWKLCIHNIQFFPFAWTLILPYWSASEPIVLLSKWTVHCGAFTWKEMHKGAPIFKTGLTIFQSTKKKKMNELIRYTEK